MKFNFKFPFRAKFKLLSRFSLSFNRSLKLRLIVAIPITTASLTMASGFLTLQLCRQLLKKSGIHESAFDIMYIAIWIIGLVLVSILSGILLALGIVRPLSRFVKQAKSRIPAGVKSKESPDIDELSQFNSAFGETLISLDQYITDSYILNRMPEGIISIDSNGTINRVNQVAANIVEYDSSAMVGRKYTDFFSDVDDENNLCSMIKDALEKRNSYYYKQAAAQVGDRTIDIMVSLHPIQDETKSVASLLIAFRSMSEAMQVRYRIRQIDQLATIGTISAGLAHEIRNPLGYISNLVELLQPKMSSDPSANSYLSMIMKGISRLNSLVEELLVFSKSSGSVNRTEIDLHQFMAEAIAIAQNAVDNSDRIKLVEKYDPLLVRIYADSEKMIRALSNILINAYQATPDSGQITISTELISNSSGRDLSIISITNTGSYIPSKEMERIFSPFFTTKSAGTGLGLPITMQIITAHSGSITVISQPGEGTTFRVELPVVIR